jgi:hypothetical protein
MRGSRKSPPPPTPAFTIPDETPFSLTALNGTDADGDPITYCWEEADLGPAKAGNAPDNGSSALFRSFLPTANPTRTFPRWRDLLANQTQTIGEKLPLTTRKMDFRVTVRDGKGGFGMDSIRLNVVNTGTGFKVTAPNTGVAFAQGEQVTVTWDVAGTTANGINTANVNILLSTNATPVQGEPSFPVVLAANTPNDGSEVVTLPDVSTAKARVMVQPVDNVYFDVSDANFTIGGPALITPASIVSQKNHGSAGLFEVDLPLVGAAGVESRSGGATNSYTLVFRFDNPIANVGGASVSSGTGSVSGRGPGADPRDYVVTLSGVTNAQTITVTLHDVTDVLGNNNPNVTGSMAVLVGDSNGDRAVNSGDAQQVRNRSGQVTDATNFRSDVNADGAVNSGDAFITRRNSGTGITP